MIWHPDGSWEDMNIEIHAPSTLVLVVSLALAVLALICFPPNHYRILDAIMPYAVAALGTTDVFGRNPCRACVRPPPLLY